MTIGEREEGGGGGRGRGEREGGREGERPMFIRDSGDLK